MSLSKGRRRRSCRGRRMRRRGLLAPRKSLTYCIREAVGRLCRRFSRIRWSRQQAALIITMISRGRGSPRMMIRHRRTTLMLRNKARVILDLANPVSLANPRPRNARHTSLRESRVRVARAQAHPSTATSWMRRGGHCRTLTVCRSLVCRDFRINTYRKIVTRRMRARTTKMIYLSMVPLRWINLTLREWGRISRTSQWLKILGSRLTSRPIKIRGRT